MRGPYETYSHRIPNSGYQTSAVEWPSSTARPSEGLGKISSIVTKLELAQCSRLFTKLKFDNIRGWREERYHCKIT